MDVRLLSWKCVFWLGGKKELVWLASVFTVPSNDWFGSPNTFITAILSVKGNFGERHSPCYEENPTLKDSWLLGLWGDLYGIVVLATKFTMNLVARWFWERESLFIQNIWEVRKGVVSCLLGKIKERERERGRSFLDFFFFSNLFRIFGFLGASLFLAL